MSESSSSLSMVRAEADVGVRQGETEETRGGVDDDSNPGGLDGDRRGRNMVDGEQSSLTARLGEQLGRGCRLALLLLERISDGSTVVGESGGEAGGVRLSIDLRRVERGDEWRDGLLPP